MTLFTPSPQGSYHGCVNRTGCGDYVDAPFLRVKHFEQLQLPESGAILPCAVVLFSQPPRSRSFARSCGFPLRVHSSPRSVRLSELALRTSLRRILFLSNTSFRKIISLSRHLSFNSFIIAEQVIFARMWYLFCSH